MSDDTATVGSAGRSSESVDLPTRFVKVIYGASHHRKFRQMARSLGISRFEAFGMTVALWEWVDSVRPYGDLPRDFSATDLADTLLIDDLDPEELLQAWLDADLIEDTGSCLAVRNWMKPGRTGADAERRVVQAKKAAHARHHKNKKSQDCEFCMTPESSQVVPERAGALPELAPTSASTSASMSASTSDGGTGVKESGVVASPSGNYAPDDPERPFDESDAPSTTIDQFMGRR